MGRSKELTYSQALTELEKILAEIESEEISVDLLTEKVVRAAHLIKFCKDRLRSTEEEVKKVFSDIQGNAGPEEDVK